MSIERVPEKVKVSKLHVLVHPGFLSYPDDFPEGQGLSEDELENSRILLKKYVEVARQMGEDEFLVLVTVSDSVTLLEHIADEYEYAECIQEIERILGDRLVVITNELDFGDANFFPFVQSKMYNAHYYFDSELEVHVYGETAEECVVECANNVYMNSNLRKQPKIRLLLTDYRFGDDKVRKAIVNRIQARYDDLFKLDEVDDITPE